jgi:hypothetical protein
VSHFDTRLPHKAQLPKSSFGRLSLLEPTTIRLITRYLDYVVDQEVLTCYEKFFGLFLPLDVGEKGNSIHVGLFDLLSANYNEQKSVNLTHPIQNEELTNIQKRFKLLNANPTNLILILAHHHTYSRFRGWA